MKSYIVYLLLFFCIMDSCSTIHNNVEEIRIDKYKDNFLKIAVQIKTSKKVKTWVAYWPANQSEKSAIITPKSNDSEEHKHILMNLLPDTKYKYKIYSEGIITDYSTKTYEFVSPNLPIWLQNQFATLKDSVSILPEQFQNGFMLLNKREAPGCVYLVDHKGRIRWYHMVDGEGIKVTHFTRDTTILSILGTNDEPTSYGSEILEVNLNGDTVNYLKKNTGDLRFQIHHEILKDKNGHYITLFVDKRPMDLQKQGGKAKDTITGDGIVILDKKGKAVYKWSVFDVINPLSDPDILKHKKDWMHANSVNYDLDGNFLISFYNNGQIWKIDAHTGKVLWRFGRDGNILMPKDCSFSQAHAVHMTKDSIMIFFNNGIDKRISEGYGIKINQKNRTSSLIYKIVLPPDIYNDRMGSMYRVNDSLFLCCSSKRKIAVLLNRKGTLLWDMETAVPSYRIEFINQEQLAPYLVPLP